MQEIARGRRDPAWRRVVRADSVARADPVRAVEQWDEISPASVNREPTVMALASEAAGPSVVRLQILLDRALFSPGIIDGRWGKNTEKAIHWLQEREGLTANGTVDEATFQRIVQLSGAPTQVVRPHVLTAEDVEGPFIEIPTDIYERAELDCTCYESLAEKLAERFHASRELLETLNAGTDLNTLEAGDTLHVPNVRPEHTAENIRVASLRISDEGHFVHALDARGRILFHFPSTLGSAYDPSPSGDFRIVSITEDPWWHYQPEILADVPDDLPDARIPPGPNNAVGVVWMALSKPHYGIHGTKAPETIGYVTSAGCVRLTNWDARFLARRVAENTPVTFTDIS
jgi:peptidoglycan hydrolase-like protein with peptidoglycan-binding domain